MISAQQYKDAVTRAAGLLQRAGIIFTPQERERLEVADFGLGLRAALPRLSRDHPEAR